MTNNPITIPSIQLSFANYQSNLNLSIANLKEWNDMISKIVKGYLEEVIGKAGLPAYIDISEFDGKTIIDFHLTDRILVFIPAKNGKIGVNVTEAEDEDNDTPVRSTPVNYHDPKELENGYLVMNYVNFMIETLNQWDSQPD